MVAAQGLHCTGGGSGLHCVAVVAAEGLHCTGGSRWLRCAAVVAARGAALHRLGAQGCTVLQWWQPTGCTAQVAAAALCCSGGSQGLRCAVVVAAVAALHRCRGLRCTALMTADRLPVKSTKSYTAWLREDNEELVRT